MNTYTEAVIGDTEGTKWAKLTASWKDVYEVSTLHTSVRDIAIRAYRIRFALNAQHEDGFRVFAHAFLLAVNRYWLDLYAAHSGPSPLANRSIQHVPYDNNEDVDLGSENGLWRSRRDQRRARHKLETLNELENDE